MANDKFARLRYIFAVLKLLLLNVVRINRSGGVYYYNLIGYIDRSLTVENKM